MNEQALIEKCLKNAISNITCDTGRYYDPSLNLATNAMRLVKDIKRLFENQLHSLLFAQNVVVPNNFQPTLSQLLKAAWAAIKKISSWKINHSEKRQSYVNWLNERNITANGGL
jgi:hypothetical protein